MKEFLVGKRILTKEEGEQLYLTVSRKKDKRKQKKKKKYSCDD